MSILVIAEHDNQSLKAATRNAITAATQLNDDVQVLIAGNNCDAVAQSAAQVQGVAKVLLTQDEAFAHQLPENIAPLVVSLASNYSHVLAPATTTGKNLMPRVAALLDVAQVSDVLEIESDDTFVHPIYAGNVLAKVQSNDAIKIITVRTTAFAAANAEGNNADISVIESSAATNGKARFLNEELTQSDRPELTAADIVISGGRGLGSAENFSLLEQIADKLGAAIGASRAAVDAGYVPNDFQVGQTGKVVAPKLYVAVGISGAIQHVAGMKDSGIVVAINKDEEAPIFQIADYGIVGDLFEVLPELATALDNL
ncbi:MAG: electron transfer flavoprotein subunit alpha/FixB family protein [Pseudomonadales bacterium]